MPKTRLRVLAMLALIALWGCSANVVVTKLDKQTTKKRDMNGFAYALPRTVVMVELPVKRTKLTAGKYAALADLFFFGQQAIPADATAVKIGVDRPTMKTRGEPDPDESYFLETQGKASIKQATTFKLTEQGAITGLKAEADNQLSDVILSGISAVTGIVTRLGAVDVPLSEAELKKLTQTEQFLVFLGHPELKENFGKLEKARKAALVVQCSPEVRSAVVACKDEELTEAKGAYDAIRDYKSNTKGMRQGESGMGSSVPFLVAERDKIAGEMLRTNFTGEAKPSTWKGVFEIRPTQAITCYELLKLSGDKLCLTADLRGAKPPPGSWIDANGCPSGVPVTLEFALDPADQLATVVQENFNEPSDDSSLRYRIPAQMKASVKADQDLAGEAWLMVAQYGLVASVPPKLGGKAVAYDMNFWASTGGVKSFSLTSSPLLTKGTVDSLSTSTNTYLDARNKQREAEAEAADTLNQLERQRKLLENEKAIRDLCLELGKTDCPL